MALLRIPVLANVKPLSPRTVTETLTIAIFKRRRMERSGKHAKRSKAHRKRQKARLAGGSGCPNGLRFVIDSQGLF